MFHLFDPADEVDIQYGHLPHWFQPEVTYFVTFRTADSVPRGLAELWNKKRLDWLARQGIDGKAADWKQRVEKLPKLTRYVYHREFSEQFLEYLDRGYGSCPFKQAELAAEVASALEHFDGVRYELGDYVIMPNHVHLLVCLKGDTHIEAQERSWKKYSATQINAKLNRTGEFWKVESFDHLVRSPEQFERFQRYIAENPAKARLRAGEYLYRKK